MVIIIHWFWPTKLTHSFFLYVSWYSSNIFYFFFCYNINEEKECFRLLLFLHWLSFFLSNNSPLFTHTHTYTNKHKRELLFPENFVYQKARHHCKKKKKNSIDQTKQENKKNSGIGCEKKLSRSREGTETVCIISIVSNKIWFDLIRLDRIGLCVLYEWILEVKKTPTKTKSIDLEYWPRNNNNNKNL